MRKLILIVIGNFILSVCIAQNQSDQNKDSTRSDSAIIDEIKDNVLDNLPVISLDENDLSEGNAQNVSSLLTAGRDPFYSAAPFNFSPLRFHMRGYEGDMTSVFMNGIPMESIDNGFTPFGLWGGLNDVMRNRDISLGLRNNTFSFGNLSSTTNIDSRASKQRKQTSFSYALSNRNYTTGGCLQIVRALVKKDGHLVFPQADDGQMKVMPRALITIAGAILRAQINVLDKSNCFHLQLLVRLQKMEDRALHYKK